MMNSDVVWSPETLDPWLQRPSQFIPGSRMVFVGIRNPQDRANLIAFLQLQTSPDAN
jgi:cytochrome c